MAYARKGPNSDIYLYAGGEFFHCLGCSIFLGDTKFEELVQVGAHVLDHIAYGDKVPYTCIQRIISELPEADGGYDEEPPATCDVCFAEAEPGAPLSHCIDCGNCLDHCECSTPDYDAMAKDALIDELYDGGYV